MITGGAVALIIIGAAGRRDKGTKGHVPPESSFGQIVRVEPGQRPRPPGRADRPPRSGPVPVEVAGEVVPGHPAIHRARVPVAGVPDGHPRRRLLHSVHRPLPAAAVRLHQRCPAVELAGVLLRRQRWTRNRRVPTVHPRACPGLPGHTGHRLSNTAFPRPGAGQVVAAGHPALPDHRRCWSPIGGGGAPPVDGSASDRSAVADSSDSSS